MVARHGHLVDRKWIAQEDVGDQPLLASSEIGPVADVVSLYNAVEAQRVAPITKETLLMIVVPLLVPMLVVASLQVPIGELLMKVLAKLV